MWTPFSFSAVRRGVSAALVLALWAGAAMAGEAGHVVFVIGDVRAGGHPAQLNQAIAEGDEIATGADGYIYMKTIDDGLLILRPASRARITAYHIDKDQPANTRVKLELLSGVARSVSGKGVKLARQNFRFNTPVAAIGVRGTDFTVFTDQETSRVTVLSGAIIISGFSGGCSPSGVGPCEHAASRELTAGQVGQMLQVRRGQATPQLMSVGTGSTDSSAPPRPDEPTAKGGGAQPIASDPSLDPRKSEDLLQQASIAKAADLALTTPPVATAPSAPIVVAPPAVTPPVVTPPVVTPPVVAPPVAPVTPVVQSELVWGRWAAVLGQDPNVDTGKLTAAGATRVATNSYYTVLRTAGETVQMPQTGSVGFALNQSEAFVLNNAGVMSAATLENGKLNVDFGKSSFATSFDLLTGTDRFSLQAQGAVTSDGLLAGNNQFAAPTNMTVNGALGAKNDAAYVFSTRLDANRTANGVTYWTK